MMSLATFRFIGRHAGNMLSGICLAAILAHLVGKLIAGAQLATFISLSLSWILIGVSVIVRERHGKQDSVVMLSIEPLPLVMVFITVVLVVACLVARYEPVAIVGPAIGILGTILGVLFYIAAIAGAVQKRKLEADLANKPTESSNQTLQPTPSRLVSSLPHD
jgi:hypothetical protein